MGEVRPFGEEFGWQLLGGVVHRGRRHYPASPVGGAIFSRSDTVSGVTLTTEGRVFEAVQLAGVFADSKGFVDAVPRFDDAVIEERFDSLTRPLGRDALRRFVDENFALPTPSPPRRPSGVSVEQYLHDQWPLLLRTHTTVPRGSSLLALPHPYVVPGGRFDELFYWDTFFTGLGLLRHGHVELFTGMVDNLVFLQESIGHIPNGSRMYLASRSQPPLLSAMVRALMGAGVDGHRYLPALLREHAFWSTDDRVVTLGLPTAARYFDALDTPRPESFAEDVHLAGGARRGELFRNLRAGAESGWDFSSRWCANPMELATIETTDVIPVDLNVLLVELEALIAELLLASGEKARAEGFRIRGLEHAALVRERSWDGELAWFMDLDRRTGERRPAMTLAGVLPLVAGIASPEQATAAARTLRDRFLAPGGLRTTLVRSGQQWDAPNGWAPLQWWAVEGLQAYGFAADAAEIADRWVETCRRRFLIDGALLEKYDVEEMDREPSGGEYEVQAGFGWTNGVLIDLLARGYGRS